MKFVDIKGFKKADLIKKTAELKADLFQLEMKNSLGQLGNPLQIRYLRKDIARLQTAMNQKD